MPYQSDNEIIVDDIVPSVTREFLEDNFLNIKTITSRSTTTTNYNHTYRL